MAQAYADVVDFIQASLTDCDFNVGGTCYERPPPGRGYIVYSVRGW